MDHIASTLGLTMPLQTARDSVMKPLQSRRRSYHAMLSSTDSMFYMDFKKTTLSDDDTASTVSSGESYSFPSSVSFAKQLVTEVYERPRTTATEKRALYYSHNDFASFRHDLIHGVPDRDTVVKFPVNMVTEVHRYSAPVNKESLYYTESDLQSFLDDFIDSLNEPSSSV